jgi:toxin ParE1/3/4
MSPRRRKGLPLLWSQRAWNDLQEIESFIAADDPRAAKRWTGRLALAAERAALMPLSGRIVPEFGREEIREILQKNYRIVYHVGEERVVILTVFESHRQALIDEGFSPYSK